MQKLRFICKIYIIFIASKEDRLKIDLINENQRSKNTGRIKCYLVIKKMMIFIC